MTAKSDQIMWEQLFALSPDSNTSLQQQIREALVAAILEGHIRTDMPLPSSRKLAEKLGVARNTVMLAYQHLADEGYLLARERSGYYVDPEILRNRVEPTDAGTVDDRDSMVAWNSRLRLMPSRQRNIVKPANWQQYPYPFIYGQVDPKLFPVNEWRECYRHALSAQALTNLARDQVDADDPLLVEQVQTRVLPRRGVWASSEEILITLGTQNALYLLAELLIRPDSAVGIEDPGYPDARNILALKSQHLRALPVDHKGLIVGEHLDACDYVFATPSHQSPTTVTMPLGRREALLERAAAADFIVIEDDYESEINFLCSPTPALKSLDRAGRVLYLGSLSKTLDPGLRLGYLVGPAELIREARALRRLMLRHPPTNNQRAAALFLSLGHYDALVQRLSRVYRERWLAMGEALERYLPNSYRVPTFGGTAYWVRGPEHLNARELSLRAAEQGVLLEPGDVNFFSEPPPQNYFRLGFSSISAGEIEPGIARLAALIAHTPAIADPQGRGSEGGPSSS
jgi:GntR family transcriptional regulator/MocR family aminotransferase